MLTSMAALYNQAPVEIQHTHVTWRLSVVTCVTLGRRAVERDRTAYEQPDQPNLNN